MADDSIDTKLNQNQHTLVKYNNPILIQHPEKSDVQQVTI